MAVNPATTTLRLMSPVLPASRTAAQVRSSARLDAHFRVARGAEVCLVGGVSTTMSLPRRSCPVRVQLCAQSS